MASDKQAAGGFAVWDSSSGQSRKVSVGDKSLQTALTVPHASHGHQADKPLGWPQRWGLLFCAC